MVRRWHSLALLALLLLVSSPAPCAAGSRAGGVPAARPATIAIDGTWAQYETLADYYFPAWYDAAGDRLVTLGDWDPGARELALATATWNPLPGLPVNVFPSYANTAWDPGTGEAWVLSNDGTGQALWHLSTAGGVSAAPVYANGTPPSPRSNAIVRYDPATQRLFVMGGGDPYALPYPAADPAIHVLQLGPTPAWSTLTVPGVEFGVYAAIGMDVALDPARHRLVLFNLGVPDSVWTLSIASPTAWTAVHVTFAAGSSPNMPSYNGVVLDADGDRVLAVDPSGQAWVFSLSAATWTPVATTGAAPGPRRHSMLAWDGARHRLLVNGTQGPTLTPTSDLWALALDGTPAWTQLIADQPRPSLRYYPTLACDPTRNRLLCFGGRGAYGIPITDPTWSLDYGATPAWNPLVTAGSQAAGVAYSTPVYDPVRDQLVFLDGGGSVGTLALSGGTPTWGAFSPAGTPPSSRSGGSAVYDAGRDRFLLLFGSGSSGPFLSEAWELKMSPTPTWRQLSPGGTTPPGRFDAAAAYDPAHDRVIVFGGVALPDTLPTATWSLDLSAGDGTWQQLAIPDGPSGRRSALCVLDPARDRLVLFGGLGRTLQPQPANWDDALSDTWAFDLESPGGWRSLVTPGGVPIGHKAPFGAYDPAHDRLVMTAGLNSGLLDAWTLAFTGGPTATDVALATEDIASDHVTLVWSGGTPGAAATAYRRTGTAPWQSLGTLACDGLGQFTLTDRAVTPGTRLEYRLGLATAGGERFVGATTVDVPALALALRAGLTPDRRVQLTLQLPSAGSARLALYDVSGRRVWGRNVEASASGTQAVPVETAPLGPGLYFARLQWGHEVRGTRVALVR